VVCLDPLWRNPRLPHNFVYRALRETSIGSVGLLARSVLTRGRLPTLKPRSILWSSWSRSWLVQLLWFLRRQRSGSPLLLSPTSAFLLRWRSLVWPSIRPLSTSSSTGRPLIGLGLMVGMRLMWRRMGMGTPIRRMSGSWFRLMSR